MRVVSTMRVVAVLSAVLLSSSCIHKVNGAQPSPYEQAVTYSTMLAGANDAIADTVISANKSGVLSVKDADRILHFQALIADDHQRLSSILNSGTSGAAQSADAINSILADIQKQANALITGGGLGIKNPNSQATIADSVNTILSIGPLITKQLQLAGVLK